MSQNTSHAVMSQRVEAHDSLDYFPTPPWATRALCEWLSERHNISLQTAWEPACGECDMARPLAEYFKSVEASDVNDYSRGRGVEQSRVTDFLMSWDRPPHHSQRRHDWIITNPPFRLGEQFVQQAITECAKGCAMLVRTAFLEGVGRHEGLFSVHRPFAVLQFAERVPMHKGKLTAAGSTATAYCWIVWLKDPAQFTIFDWIGKCRRSLERPGDYPVMEAAE